MAVTMRDVAACAGVSKQTVSAVINGKPGISAATTARVRQAIAELGYQPNLLAGSLRNGRTATVGLFVGDVSNSFWAEVARGVEDVAHARGYIVILCNTDDDPTREEAYRQMLRRYQAAGVVHGHVAGLPTAEFPPLDDRRGGYVATAHLLDLGHRRIGCLVAGALDHSDVGRARLQGYTDALADWALAVDDRLIVEGAHDYASARQATQELLERGASPTAIFAQTDMVAIGALAAIEHAGLRVPDDMAVIGYDGTQLAALYNPPLSTIAQPTYEMGARAIAALANQIEGIGSDLTPEPLHCELIVRRSTVPGLHEERRCGLHAEAPWTAWRTAGSPTEDGLEVGAKVEAPMV